MNRYMQCGSHGLGPNGRYVEYAPSKALCREPDPWQLGNVKDFQLFSVRVAARHRSINTLIAKPAPAHC